MWATLLATNVLYVAALFGLVAGLWVPPLMLLSVPLAVAALYLPARFSGSKHPILRALAAVLAGALAGGAAGLLPEAWDHDRAVAVSVGCATALAVALMASSRRTAALRGAYVLVAALIAGIAPDPDYSAPDGGLILVLLLPLLLAAWEHAVWSMTHRESVGAPALGRWPG